MLKLTAKLIQLRNPDFSFSKELTTPMFVSFSLRTAFSMLRAFKVLLHGKAPRGASFGKAVRLQYSGKISFGKFLKAGRNVTLSGLGVNGLKIGNNVSIGDHSSVIVSTTLNEIGIGIEIFDNVGIGEFAYLGGAGGLNIGEGCIIGQYFSCHPENHNYTDKTQEIRKQGTSRQGIEIGENCWIGSKVTVLDGIKIGNGCVIAAGAVVNKSFPDNSIIGGVPAKLIKTR